MVPWSWKRPTLNADIATPVFIFFHNPLHLIFMPTPTLTAGFVKSWDLAIYGVQAFDVLALPEHFVSDLAHV